MRPKVSTAALEMGGGRAGDSSNMILFRLRLAQMLLGLGDLERDSVQSLHLVQRRMCIHLL